MKLNKHHAVSYPAMRQRHALREENDATPAASASGGGLGLRPGQAARTSLSYTVETGRFQTQRERHTHRESGIADSSHSTELSALRCLCVFSQWYSLFASTQDQRDRESRYDSIFCHLFLHCTIPRPPPPFTHNKSDDQTTDNTLESLES